MSFSDITSSSMMGASRGGMAPRPPRPPTLADDSNVQHLGDSLQRLQRNVMSLKEKITDMRKREVNMTAKKDLDKQIQEIRQFEGQLKNQLDGEMRQLDQLPRTSVAQKRIALGKLMKDFDRVKLTLNAIVGESATIKVAAPTSSSSSSSSSSSKGSGKNPFDDEEGTNFNSRQPRLIQTLQGKEVDEAIVRERERDLRKINRDLQLVNEMFKDMAEIVDKQAVMVNEVVVQTEKSHEKAKTGLAHVQKAANNQSSCVLS
jgi:t-SNARE complex subunit (syntaxin)